MTRPIVTPHGILADAYGRGDGDGDGDGDGGDVFLPRGDGDGDGGDVFLPCGDGGGPGCWRSPRWIGDRVADMPRAERDALALPLLGGPP